MLWTKTVNEILHFNIFAVSHEIHLFYLHNFQTAVQIFLQIFPDS